jgi:hypothetical protein
MARPASALLRLAKRALRRPSLETADAWPLLQSTLAATTAWIVARRLVHHHQPFFAPISALVSLNTSLGERGLNALRLLLGVVVGIGVAELTLLVLGGGYGSLALATFVALTIARMFGSARIVLAQAAISAILTIAVANGEVGYQRLTDALIGAGVALVFSQLLFSPEPLRLLRRFERNALAAMASALELTARGLDGEESSAERAVESQRELRDHLSELARVRKASTRVARHSLAWRTQITPLVRESEDAGYLDLLGGSCLLLTRTSLEAAPDDRRLLAPCIRALSTTLADIAPHPGDRTARQGAVEGSLRILHEMRDLQADPTPELSAALTAARIAVNDLLLFAGVQPDEARAATREEPRKQHAVLEVPAPASAKRRRFRGLGDRLQRLFLR